jgi:hypothetical protein
VDGENQLTCNIQSYCHVQTHSEEMKELLVARNRSTLTRHSKIKVTKENHATKYKFKGRRGGGYTGWEQRVNTKLSFTGIVSLKADSHIARRAHAASMPFPCHAVPLRV